MKEYMLKLRFLFLSVLLSAGLLKSQDSTQTRLLNHEIGFNAVGLLGQFRFFTPLPDQSPFLIFYNVYYKDLIGLRFGAGISQKNSHAQIGEYKPTIYNSNRADLRTGVSYNFAKSKRVTLNGFADFVYADNNQKSVTTSTVFGQGGQPRESTKTNQTTSIGTGAQAGVGVKINIHKILCLYAELPVTHMTYKTTTNYTTATDGQETLETKSVQRNSSVSIFLPTTVYLVLSF